jgi:hypothetical protein
MDGMRSHGKKGARDHSFHFCGVPLRATRVELGPRVVAHQLLVCSASQVRQPLRRAAVDIAVCCHDLLKGP